MKILVSFQKLNWQKYGWKIERQAERSLPTLIEFNRQPVWDRAEFQIISFPTPKPESAAGKFGEKIGLEYTFRLCASPQAFNV
jgi:hypothetical protein